MESAIALGVVVLTVALFMPTLINSTTTDNTSTFELEEGNETNVTEKLVVEVDNIKTASTPNNSTITVRNSETLNTSTKTIDAGNNKTYTVDGDNVTITLDNTFESGGSEFATITAEYDPKFGWDNGARTFMENMELILAALAVFLVTGVLMSALD